MITISVPCISENYIEIITLLCVASKGFMKALKAFIKAFEATQRSVKIKIYLNFFTLFWIGTLRVKNKDTINIKHSAQ